MPTRQMVTLTTRRDVVRNKNNKQIEMTTPGYRKVKRAEYMRQYMKNKYDTDPQHKERMKDMALSYYRRKKQEKAQRDVDETKEKVFKMIQDFTENPTNVGELVDNLARLIVNK